MPWVWKCVIALLAIDAVVAMTYDADRSTDLDAITDDAMDRSGDRSIICIDVAHIIRNIY